MRLPAQKSRRDAALIRKKGRIMDNSIDRLLQLAEDKKSRVIWRFSPEIQLLPENSDSDPSKRMSPLVEYCSKAFVELAPHTPALMFDYSAFALYGVEGLISLSMLLTMAKTLGFYVILDACFAGDGALKMCHASFSTDNAFSKINFPADAVTVSPYCAAEDLKAMAILCREEDKAVFVCAKTRKVTDKESFENIKTDQGQKLYEAAVDDAGAFGESYVGEKGYSVLGFMTAPVENSSGLRDLDRWGIALVKASADDLDDDNTYAFFYPQECEGEFVVLTDSEMIKRSGQAGGSIDFKSTVSFFGECVKKVEEKRLEKK